nr:TAXI family TRAP transporter solute-binding subunit [Sedimentibacter sp.]
MKKFFIIVMVLVLSFSLFGCTKDSTDTANAGNDSPNTESNRPSSIVISSGNSGGTYYYIAAGQSKILTEKIEGLSVTTESTTGSPVENGTFTSQSSDTMGIVTLDGLSAALEGNKDKGFTKPLDNLRMIQAGHKLTLYFVTLEESGIKSISDLKGKKLGLPTVGNTAYFQAVAILEEYGIDLKDVTSTPMQYSEQSDALKDGTIDVAIVAGGVPVAAVTDLDTTKNIRLLTIDEDKKASLIQKYPYWAINELPAGTYSDQTEPVNVMIAQIVLICNKDLDSDLVYEITKTLNESTEELGQIHQNGLDWNIENTKIVYDQNIVPFHEGALKYYEEVFK